MTIYTYDTEFLEDGSTIDLISIGIVCEDGREYYAVNSDMNVDRIRKDDWLLENVWKHLPLRGYRATLTSVGGGRNEMRTKDAGVLDTNSVLVKPKWVIANEVRDFLLAAESPQLWAYYGAYDHIALMQLWGKMIHKPQGIPMFTHDIVQLWESFNVEDLPEQDGTQHNALNDARWNWEALKYLGSIQRQQEPTRGGIS